MSVGMPFASFLAAVLVLVPLPWHWRARNIPTLSIIAWLFIVNMTHGVNTIAWYHNVDIKLVVWCDITVKMDVGANIALPAACFCLCMHLERIASGRQVTTTFSEKRRRMLVDLAICVGIPMIYMALQYVVQGHLFDIVEDFGCRAEDYVSIPEFFLMWLLPILFCLGTFVLSGFAFVHFLRRRATFARHLANSSVGLTPTRYFRLMAMSIVEMFWALLIISITLYFNYRAGLRPWISWANVHSNFSNINQFPTVLISPNSLRWTYFLWWTTPVSAYLFFVFFAFGADAMKEYGACIEWVRRHIFRQTARGGLGSAKLPLFSPAGRPTKLQFITIDIAENKTGDTASSPTDIKGVYPPESPGSSCSTSSTLAYCEHLNGPQTPIDVVASIQQPTICLAAAPASALLHEGGHESPIMCCAHTVHAV